MAKTLVINGADFSTNKLDTVTFADVPCTGITLALSSLNVTSFSPVQLEYTVTPSNTSDTVIWTSSNQNVATINAGILTPVGIGETTITATCGSYSDTLTVTCSLAVHPKFYFAGVSGTVNGMATYEAPASYTKLGSFGSGSEATTNKLAATTGTSVENPYAIKIPANTTKVKISANSAASFYNYSNSVYVFSKDESYNGSSAIIKCISVGTFNFNQNMPFIVDVPSGADAFNVALRLATAASESDNPDTLASTLGITIEFLTA